MQAEHGADIAIHSCPLCEYTETAAIQKVHNLTSGAHSCPLCEYADSCTMTLEHDTAEHWYVCSICHDEESRMKHIWTLKNGLEVCKFCNAAKELGINKIKLPSVLLTE